MNRSVLIYIVATLFAAGMALTLMNRWTMVRGIAYFDSKAPGQDRISILAKQVGFVTFDVRSKSSFDALRKISIPNAPKTPTLVVTTTPPDQLVVGAVSVNNLLTNISTPREDLRQGRAALLAISLLTVLVAVNRKKLVWAAPFVGPVGLVVAALLPGHCLLCSAGVSPVESLALPFASLLFMASSIVITFGFAASKAMLRGLTLLFGMVPIGQIYLQTVSPRFCPVCLTICLLSLVQFFSGLEFLATSTLKVFSLPKTSWAAACVGLPLCLFKTCSALWMAPTAQTAQAELTNLVGSAAASRLPGFIANGTPTALMVSAPGCHACASARSYLQSHHIEYLEISPCSILRRADCFDTKGEGFFTPLLLVISRSGQIEYQHSGWPMSETEQARLASDLTELASH